MNKQQANQIARFELRIDENGRRYWWGAEDGWKDETEIGLDALLMLDGRYFPIGSVLVVTEPDVAGDEP